MAKAAVVSVGEVYGMLTVVGDIIRRKSMLRIVQCKCACGADFWAYPPNLVSGNTKSCGCLKYTRSGLSNTPTWRSWQGMMSRCYKENNKSYRDYGARGIMVYEPWHDYETFLAAVGEKPSVNHSIERLNNNANYEPGNVVWAVRKQQNNNTRKNVRIELNGRTQTMAQWCEELNLPYGTIQARRASGWSDEDALTTPISDYGKERTVSYKGHTGTVAEVAKAMGLNRRKINKRLSNGWTIEEAIEIADGRTDRSPGGGKCRHPHK